MRILLSCVLILSAVLMDGALGCCYPDVFEGKEWSFGDDRYIYYRMDFGKKYLYKSFYATGNEYNITDFGHKRQYTVTSTGCSYATIPDKLNNQYKKCPEHSLYYKLGDQFAGFNVELKRYISDDFEFLMTVYNKDNVCHPILANTKMGGALTAVWSTFYDGPITTPSEAEVVEAVQNCSPS